MKEMPEGSLLKALMEFVHRHALVKTGDKLVLAVSGGIDSMALLDLFHRFKQSHKLELVVAHFNHQLRASESDLDEQFVRSKAKEYGIEIYVESVNTKGIAESSHRSLQETARDMRYRFLFELLSSLEYTNIVTAHQSDDNAETILFNFFRGSGVHGLTGIPVRRKDKHIIRPLLFARREQIRHYVETEKLSFREDSSNNKTDYTRNYIRHELLPVIRENINPGVSATIVRSAETFQRLEDFLLTEVQRVLPTVLIERNEWSVSLNRTKILELPSFLQEYVLKTAIQDFIAVEIGFSAVKSMLGVLNSDTGSFYTVSNDIVFYRDRENMIIKKMPPKAEFNYAVIPNKSYEFELFTLGINNAQKAELNDNPFVEYIDADRIGKTLKIRNWQQGDWFIPLGMGQKKKLSDYFIDEKIPLFDKELIAILESDTEIVWICGHRLDDRFKITPRTKHILRLEYQSRIH